MVARSVLSLFLFIGCVAHQGEDVDGDGIEDFLDADDDADGFFDIVEFKCDSDSKDRTSIPVPPEASDDSEEAAACRAILSPNCNVACNTGLLGACAQGLTRCDSGTTVCVANIEPMTEVCNGADDDCNGAADDNVAGVGMACETGIAGPCNPGTTICAGTLVCQPTNVTAEVCDGLDNDCNRTTDDVPSFGCTDESKLGSCRMGVTRCLGSPPSEVCQAQEPAQEICSNGLDEDCNGTPDDGDGCGCVDQDLDGYGNGGGCLGADCDDTNRDIHPGVADLCNDTNDDCDGETDEDFESASCIAPQAFGECRNGASICMSGQTSCMARAPASELCDGLDNDCDDEADETPMQGEPPMPGVGDACSSGSPGVCSAGTTICTAGSPRIQCQSTILPGSMTDTCNGQDDDCDSDTDEDFAIACDGATWGVACGPGAACARGTQCASLIVGATQGTCLRICQGAGDCLSGQTCQPVPGGVRLCVSLCDPAQSTCPAGQTCSPSGFCVPPPCNPQTGMGCPVAAPSCQVQGFCLP